MTSENVANGSSGTNGTHPTNGALGNGVNGNAADLGAMQRFALIAGIIGIAVFALFGIAQGAMAEGGARQFFTSYLVAWTFWLALPIGAMGLTGIQFITGASWGVLLRRPFEAATRTFPLMVVLFLPLAFSVFSESTSPYPWAKSPAELTSSPTQIQDYDYKFRNWLNPTSYLIRFGIYFVVWGISIYLLNKWSRQVEATDDIYARRYMENFSGPMTVIFVLGNMFVVTDLVMSVQLSFSSTMFPLIYSINQLLCTLAMSIAIFLTLAKQSPTRDVLRPKFQIDMGSFMLGLTLIWTYMNFAQYMLIWIGNLPEEIPYYLVRTNDEVWRWVSRILGVFHFALPFLLLLFRDVKLHRGRLRALALLLVFMCGVDVIWWIEPATYHPGPPLYLIMDVAAIVGMGGIWGWMFLNQLKKHSLLPTNYIGQLPKAPHHAH